MDPVEVNEDNNPLAATAAAAAAARPLIVQLSPIPGNIYDSDRFFYDPAGILSLGGQLGPSWLLRRPMAIRSWSTTVRIFKNFRRRIFPLSFV